MNYKFVLTFIALTFSLTFKLTAQNSVKNDSLIIGKTVSDFFGWYIEAIKQNKRSEFEPTFIESKNGMTTLNFTKYFANLVKYGFSDSLLSKEKLSYQKCIANIEKVKYTDFNAKITDLDDFEEIDCDFSNYYRWTGGQEPIDGIRIKSLHFKNADSATIMIEYFDYNKEKKENYFWGSNLISLSRTKGGWKIENINWR